MRKSRSVQRIFLNSIFLFCLFIPSVVAAQDAFEQLRAEYLKLRNTDPALEEMKRWEQLPGKMVGLVEKHPNHTEAATLLYDASIVYEQLYKKRKREGDLHKAIDVLEQLTKKYSKHRIADDASVRKGDILLFLLKKPDRAREVYQFVVDHYPEADMFSVAQQRLLAMAQGQEEEIQNIQEDQRQVRSDRTVVVIDPGHGGEDYGARGVAGLLEKDVTLAIAFELEKLLTQDSKIEVRLTRRGDVFVPLLKRTEMANTHEADLFLSLHVNASARKNLSGLEVYYLDNTNDRSSQKLAERENSSSKFGGGVAGDLQYMLSDLIQSAKLPESIQLSHVVYDALFGALKGKWKMIKGLGVKKAPFYVLVGAHMPCVLVEMFFVDHREDGKRLASQSFRKDVALGLSQGIKKYLEART